MRLTVVGHIFNDSFARCVVAAASELGHQVRAVDPAPLISRLRVRVPRLARMMDVARGSRSVERFEDRLVARELLRSSPELVLVTGKSLHPGTVVNLRKKLSVPVVHWFSDPLTNFGRQYSLAGAYDAVFFKEPYVVEFARNKLRLNASYLPEACHPAWHHRVVLTDAERTRYGCDLTIAGNMYVYRARLLEPLAAYDLRIWGNQFPSWLDSPLRSHHGNIYVAEEEKAKAFNAAKIVVNTFHFGEIRGVNARTFEAAGCGAFQIAEARAGLAELFEPEREIETFESAAELKDKVDFYLSHPDARRAIADASYLRAHRDHTFAHRLRQLIAIATRRVAL